MAVRVNTDNFARAETERMMASLQTNAGGVNRLSHSRVPTAIDQQPVIRMNRDTLYSAAVFDLDAGPVTVTIPEAGTRFMSIQVITEDGYSPAVMYGAGRYTLNSAIGTRYIMTAVRILVNPLDPKDVATVHALQDALGVEQAGRGRFEVPDWDQAGQKKIREALLVLGATLPDSRKMFGARDEVDPVRHLIGAAMAWGGNPETDAMYINVTPPMNDGRIAHGLTVKDVPVDGFWSISVYNAGGYFEANARQAYTINNVTAKKSRDGSITVRFGDWSESTVNCLPIVPGWNYLVRLYRPRAEILSGKWIFPEAEPSRVLV